MDKVITLVSMLIRNNISLEDVNIFGLSVKATRGRSYTCRYQGKKYLLTISRINGTFEMVLADRHETKKRFFA